MAKLINKGGKGSGNWGHAGRPGKVGGSAPRGTQTYQQGELFDVGDYGGSLMDEAMRRALLTTAGYSDDVIQDLNPDIPIDVLIRWHDAGAVASDYNKAYAKYSGEPEFNQFVASAGSLGNFLKFAEWKNANSGLDETYWNSIVDLSEAFGIPFPDAAEYLGFLGDGYGYDIVDHPYDAAYYYKRGVTDKWVLYDLVENETPLDVVTFNIEHGADTGSFKELTAQIFYHRRIGVEPSLDGGAIVGTPPPDSYPESSLALDDEMESRTMMNHTEDLGRVMYQSTEAASEQDIEGFASSWISSSNGNRDSFSLQTAARELFHDTLGTDFNEHQRELAGNFGDISDDRLYKAKDVLSVSYANAQKYLKDHGIDHIRLYRGVVLDSSDVEGVRETELLTLDEDAMESWSLHAGDAEYFAKYVFAKNVDNSGRVGLVLTADIPAERIAGLSFNGLGSPDEYEVVVLGASTDDQYYVDKRFDPQKE